MFGCRAIAGLAQLLFVNCHIVCNPFAGQLNMGKVDDSHDTLLWELEINWKGRRQIVRVQLTGLSVELFLQDLVQPKHFCLSMGWSLVRTRKQCPSLLCKRGFTQRAKKAVELDKGQWMYRVFFSDKTSLSLYYVSLGISALIGSVWFILGLRYQTPPNLGLYW